jgi:hypothetical protein
MYSQRRRVSERSKKQLGYSEARNPNIIIDRYL